MKNAILLVIIAVVFIFVLYFGHKASKDNQEVFEVSIAIKEHKFVPDIIEVPKHTKVKLVVHNQDSEVEEFESYDLHRERIIMPNSSITLILAPLSPGRYEFFGDFHQDTAQGAIVVRD